MCNLKGRSLQSNVQGNQKEELSSYHKYLMRISCLISGSNLEIPSTNPIILPCGANQAFRLHDFAALTSEVNGSPKNSCVQPTSSASSRSYSNLPVKLESTTYPILSNLISYFETTSAKLCSLLAQ